MAQGAGGLAHAASLTLDVWLGAGTLAMVSQIATPSRSAILRLGAFLGVLALLALVPRPVSAQLNTFDPAICPDDAQGKLTVRLSSGLAFRLPPSGFLLGRVAPPSAEPDAPPHGCPGNPIVTTRISFPYRYEALQSGTYQPVTHGIRPSLLQVFGHDGPVRVHRSRLKLFDEYKSRHEACEIQSSGLEVCWVCKLEGDYCPIEGRPAKHKSEIAWYGRALPGAHPAFEALPFAIRCHWAQDTEYACESRYKIQDGLSVSYRIRQPQLEIDDILPFDLDLRRQIEAARAPELDGDPVEIEL